MTLHPPHSLKPHEHVSWLRVCTLAVQFLRTGIFDHPILIDAESRTILDGHHRHKVALILNLRRVPCHEVAYLDDESIAVTPRRHIPVSKESVVKCAATGMLFPRKSTRHNYPTAPCHTPLTLLRV
jgi:L-serine kinase (ADP)